MVASARAISPIEHPKLHLEEVLNQDDVHRIHQASLEVIETVGVRFPSDRALDILEEAGATVDRQSQIARIPGQVVVEALAKAPPSYVLCARDPALDLSLDGEHSYLSTDGCGVEVIDLETGERRRSTKQDVAESARVADYLPQIAFYWPLVAAQDCPPETRSLHELEAAWNNTTKHVQTECIITAREAQAAIEMASAIVGGRQELRKRPILSIMQCTISPLGQDGGSLEAALVAAQAGIPVGFMTMASCCSTAPATLAGNLVVGNAEVIAVSALIELAYPYSMPPLRRPWTCTRGPIPAAGRRTTSLEQPPTNWPTFTGYHSPWAPLPPEQRSPIGKPPWIIPSLA